MKTKNTFIRYFGLSIIASILIFHFKAASEPTGSQTIKGRVIDSTEKAPLPYSTIVLFSSDSVFITGTITDSEGVFQFPKLKSGNYKVVVKFLGYNTKTISPIELQNDHPMKDLGDISLSTSNSMIDEIYVIKRKDRVENRPDKKIINISSGGITDGGVVTDALVQIPSVTLDANKNVLLRGSTQFKVLIDGVPSPLDGNEALKGIAVSNIEKIEVTTNPSSVYDSEGTAGIINIIMKKEKSVSVAAQASLNASSNGSGSENIGLMGQGKKLSYNFSFDDRRQKENSNSAITNNNFSSGITDELSTRYNCQNSLRTAKADASYQINSSNSIQGLFWLIDANSNQSTIDVLSASSLAGNTITSIRKTKVFMPQLRFNHKFKKEGSLITFFAQYNQGSEDSEQKATQLKSNQFKVNMDIPFKFLMLHNDFTLPLTDNLTILSGIDYKYSRFNYLYDYYNSDTDFWAKDEAKSNKSSFRSDITSAYVQLNGKLSGLGFQAGIRAENTDRTLKDETGLDVFNYQIISIFPSLQLNRSLGENTSIMFSYSRRLNRPRLYQLNPFRNYSNPGYVTSGNYTLVSEFQNTIELSYSQHTEKLNLSGTLYGKFAKNPIIQTSAMEQETALFTYQNAKNDRRLGTEISLSWTPASWFTGNLTGNLFNYQLETTGTDQKHKDTQVETSLNLTLYPIKDISIQSFSTLKSRSITAQGYVKGYFTTDLAISKQFFGNKLRTSVKVTDLLNGVKEDETIETSATRWNRYYKPDSRQVLVSLTFNINKFARKSSVNLEATPY